MRVRAAVTTSSGVSVEEVELNDPGPAEVLVRVEAANIAIADVGGPAVGPDGAPAPRDLESVRRALEGHATTPMDLGGAFAYPQHIVHGHTGVGIVERVGDRVGGLEVGARVIISCNPNCGVCFYCVHGRPDQCAEMVPFGPAVGVTAGGDELCGDSYVGSFADASVVRATQLTPVVTELPSDQLALIANPVLTGVGAAKIIAPIRPGSTVVVLGCGSVGLSYVQAASLAHAERIFAVDPIRRRRELAVQLGATDAVDPSECDPVRFVREHSEDMGGLAGRGADFAFEAAGDARAAEQAWSVARLTGQVVLAGIGGGSNPVVSFPYAEFSVMGGRTVHTCQMGGSLQRRDLPWLIKLVEDGSLDVAALAERTYSWADLEHGMRDVANQSVVGATFVPSQEPK